MLGDLRLTGGEEGQGLLIIVLMMTVFFAIAAIVFDVGLWVSERRGATKDADAAALAGAHALVNDLTDRDGAFKYAVDWATLNGVEPAKIDPSFKSDCSSGNSCIDADTSACATGSLAGAPWVQAKIRHKGNAFFSSFFGVTEGPDIGAIARACVGSPTGHSGLTPFAIETGASSDCVNSGDVVYGRACILREPNAAGDSGILNLVDSGCSHNGGSVNRDDFHYGSAGTCYFPDPVRMASGHNSGDLFNGLADRLAEEGLCDTQFGDGSSYDDFKEVFSIVGGAPGDLVFPYVSNPPRVFSDNACTLECGPSPLTVCADGSYHRYMPRAIDLVLVDTLNAGGTADITGFTHFYVIGCYNTADAEARRSLLNNQIIMDPATQLNRCENSGYEAVLGIPIRSLAPAIDVKNPNQNLPLSIVLAE